MRRELSLFLIPGCLLILFLEAPAAIRGLAADLEGPYGEWESAGEPMRASQGEAGPPQFGVLDRGSTTTLALVAGSSGAIVPRGFPAMISIARRP